MLSISTPSFDNTFMIPNADSDDCKHQIEYTIKEL